MMYTERILPQHVSVENACAKGSIFKTMVTSLLYDRSFMYTIALNVAIPLLCMGTAIHNKWAAIWAFQDPLEISEWVVKHGKSIMWKWVNIMPRQDINVRK